MSRPGSIEYQPALDGVRALAVLAVLLFHARVPGFGGGYIGVSVFFTLSGYLITSLLVSEHRALGTVDLGAFYSRRARRLLPASLLCIAAVIVTAAVTDVFERVDGLRVDVLGALFQVANWVFLAGSGSYQNLLDDGAGVASPLEHFWSLAIEEQFYWVWPPVMLVLFRRGSTHAARTVVVVAVTAIFCLAAPLIAWRWGPDAAYWATPARVGEILLGAVVAMVLFDRTTPRWAARLVAPSLVGLGAAVVLLPTSGGPAYSGALPLLAVASAMLLVGLQTDSRVRTAMSIAPLVWLGRISYGVYLYHWPLFLVLDEGRTGLDGPALVLLQLGATLAVAELSYRLVEVPIRRARQIPGRVVLRSSLVATAAVAVAAVVVVPAGLGTYWEVDDVAAEAASIDLDARAVPLAAPDAVVPRPTTAPLDAASSSPSIPPSPPVPQPSATPSSSPPISQPSPSAPSAVPPPLSPLPELDRPARIVVTGDSTARALGVGIINWAAANPELAQVQVAGAAGCGMLEGGERRNGESMISNTQCDGWVDEQLLPEVAATQPDVVAVLVTTWDVIDRRWDDGSPIAPTDADYAARLDATYGELVDDLVDAGAGRVVFVRPPIPDVWWLDEVKEEEEPARHEVVAEMYDRLAAASSESVVVLPLDEWFTAAGFDRDREIRPDGIHLTPEAATSLVERYVGEMLLRAALGMNVR